MKNYQWILFDADETLFHFDAFRGLQLMFSRFDIQFSQQDYEAYQTINKPLWVDYQNNQITALELQHRRFNHWSQKLGQSTEYLNKAFLNAMAEICLPLEGAVNLIHSLKNKFKLGIITNGFSELQHVRLEKTGLTNYFNILVVSELVGFAKPHPGIFEHALSLMGNPNREQVLIVGDTLESDILGGINAGIHTCWLNINNKTISENIKPHYQVASLGEIERIISE